jgi:hypothetical protein
MVSSTKQVRGEAIVRSARYSFEHVASHLSLTVSLTWSTRRLPNSLSPSSLPAPALLFPTSLLTLSCSSLTLACLSLKLASSFAFLSLSFLSAASSGVSFAALLLDASLRMYPLKSSSRSDEEPTASYRGSEEMPLFTLDQTDEDDRSGTSFRRS